MERSTTIRELLPQISLVKLLLSFALGVLLGIALVFDTIRGLVGWSLLSIGSLGTVGAALLVAVFLMFLITLGVISLYLFFALIDN